MSKQKPVALLVREPGHPVAPRSLSAERGLVAIADLATEKVLQEGRRPLADPKDPRAAKSTSTRQAGGFFFPRCTELTDFSEPADFTEGLTMSPPTTNFLANPLISITL